jgi:hypothetical protein
MLVVVLGPQTRLARAVLGASSWGKGAAFAVVARNAGDCDAATGARPGVALYHAGEPDSSLPHEDEAVAVVCCAFGVIHPGAPHMSDDLDRAQADCEAVDAIARRYSDLPLHVIFVSSVLALCPRPGREYYAGWKNVSEALIRQSAQRHGRAGVSVFYPGRLTDEERLGPMTFLHTRYSDLAEMIVSAVRHNRSGDTIVGLDSRLWLARRSLGLFWAALAGRR